MPGEWSGQVWVGGLPRATPGAPGAVGPVEPLAQYLPLTHRANSAQARAWRAGAACMRQPKPGLHSLCLVHDFEPIR